MTASRPIVSWRSSSVSRVSEGLTETKHGLFVSGTYVKMD